MHTAPKPQLNDHELHDSPPEIAPAERSRFREVVVAGLRAKQLLRGSQPRIEAHPGKRKYTTIAVEEVRRGLITFSRRALSQANQSTIQDGGEPIPITAAEHDAFTGFNAGEGP